MPDEKLELFNDDSEGDVAEGSEAEQVEEPEAEEPQVPDETPEETGEDDASPPDAVEERQGHIPVTALLDERDKRQKLEKELESLRQWRQQQEQSERQRQWAEQQRQAQQEPVDWLEDPDKRMAAEREAMQHQLWNERLNMSEMMARSSVGDEAVDAALQAFQAEVQRNPALYNEMQQMRHPYDFVVKWHKRQSFMSEVGSDPEAWREAERARLREELQAELSQKSPARTPPGSLASAPSAKGQEPASVDAPDNLQAFFTG